MTWMDWILVSLFALSALTTIVTIGQHRDAITPKSAAFGVAVNAALIVGVVVAS